MELLITIVEAVTAPISQPIRSYLLTNLPQTLVPKAHDRIYCFVQRDSELRQTAPAVRGCQRFPEWHEVVRFPLYEEETRGQRNILGSRRLFLSCGTDSGGFLGMTSVLLNGVFLRNTPTLDSEQSQLCESTCLIRNHPNIEWYVLKDGTGECGEIHLELAVAVRCCQSNAVPPPSIQI